MSQDQMIANLIAKAPKLSASMLGSLSLEHLTRLHAGVMDGTIVIRDADERGCLTLERAPTMTMQLEAHPTFSAEVKCVRGDDTGWGRMKALLGRVRR